MVAGPWNSLLCLATLFTQISSLQFEYQCPNQLVWLEYWQCPHDPTLLKCSHYLMYQSMAGKPILLADKWGEEKKKRIARRQWENFRFNKLIPNFTEIGVAKMKIPESLYEFLNDNMDYERISSEDCEISSVVNCDLDFNEDIAQLIPFKNEEAVDEALVDILTPILEEWSGQHLVFHNYYGVRRYLRGAQLALHADKPKTHIISAILNMNQEVDVPWYLTILDNQGTIQRVSLEAGEMALYESARLPHGRLEPFEGDYFDNLFVHFRPYGWDFIYEDDE